MCTSYHVFPEENIEMKEIISEAVRNFPAQVPRSGRISPSMTAALITDKGAAPMGFGISLPRRKGLLLNARSETAATSPLFGPMLRTGRCLVPAHNFFEWDERRKAYLFAPREGGLMYFAGIYLAAQPLPRFVIITRQADGAVAPIHDRMPLILHSAEYREAWLHNEQLAIQLLSLPSTVELLGRAA